MQKQLKKDKGTAGLTILLSVIVMLFVIGLLIMIFSIMGDKLINSTYTSTSGTVTNESLGAVTNGTNKSFAVVSYNNVVCALTSLNNATGGQVLTATNYTFYTDCKVILSATSLYNGTSLNASYTYSYDAENVGTEVMENTGKAIANTTQWFDIFIVITAMVVLILLVVIIITAIRSSGLIEGGTHQTGAKQVGTA